MENLIHIALLPSFEPCLSGKSCQNIIHIALQPSFDPPYGGKACQNEPKCQNQNIMYYISNEVRRNLFKHMDYLIMQLLTKIFLIISLVSSYNSFNFR